MLAPDGRILRDGKDLINFAGNDYLGLSHASRADRRQPRLLPSGLAREWRASRLVTGDHPAFAELEAKIAAKRQESALVLAGGYQTNFSALAALADAEVIGRPVAVLADRLAHHSLLQGAQLSGARLMRFRTTIAAISKAFARSTAKGEFCVVVTESVFGMDGDLADLTESVS